MNSQEKFDRFIQRQPKPHSWFLEKPHLSRRQFVGELCPVKATFVVVTNQQLYLAIGIPILFNASLIGLMIMFMNSKFEAIDKRFDDMRDLWRAELRRVEEVLDARLKHIEERH